MKDDNQTEVIETSAMAVPQERGRGGRNIRRGHLGRNGHPQCSYCKKQVIPKKIAIHSMAFQTKLLMCLNLKNYEEYQNF